MTFQKISMSKGDDKVSIQTSPCISSDAVILKPCARAHKNLFHLRSWVVEQPESCTWVLPMLAVS